MRRHLHDAEVLLRDEVSFHAQAKLIASWGWEDQRGDINSEIGNLKAVGDGNIRKGCPADKLFVVKIDQINVEVICAFGIGEAEVQSHL